MKRTLKASSAALADKATERSMMARYAPKGEEVNSKAFEGFLLDRLVFTLVH